MIGTFTANLRLVLTAVLLLAAAVGACFVWWPRAAVVPAISTEKLDVEVAALINEARADVEARPRSAASWGHLGTVLFAQNMYADCIGILAEAERLDPDEVRWPYLRGLALILQQPQEGIAVLERAALIPPRTITARLRLAEEYVKVDRLDEADALFRELLVDHPNNPRALLGRGLVLARRGQWQEALTPLEIAAQHPTARRSARIALAEAYMRLGNTVEADAQRRRAEEVPADLLWPDEFLAEARRLRTGLQPRIDQALALADNRQLDEAAALMAQVLRDHPESDEAHATLGKVLIRAGAVREAQKMLRRAIELNPNLVDGHLLLAGTHMLLKDYQAAETSYRRTIALKPTEGVAHYNLGDCRLKQGDRAEAMAAFRDAVRYRPDLVVAQVELGALLLQDGNVEEAISHLENAVRLDGKNERARSLLEQARAVKKS